MTTPVVTYSPSLTQVENGSGLTWLPTIVELHDGTPVDAKTFGPLKATQAEAIEAATDQIVYNRALAQVRLERVTGSCVEMLNALIAAETAMVRLYRYMSQSYNTETGNTAADKDPAIVLIRTAIANANGV